MAKLNKYTVHIEEGECCLVVPVAWANHIIASYKEMALAADDDTDAKAYLEFADIVKTWVEETAVDFYD